MDVVFTHGAGLDLHKRTGMACRVTPDPTGQHADRVMEGKEFGTLRRDLLALSGWLAAAGLTPVAMQSPGEDWRPVYHRWEGTVTLVLVSAAQVKQVPGRKTDKAEARWLAKLMRDGLPAASLSPPQGRRDWRDLTRYRTAWVQERSREVNRGQGVLARATMERASAAADIPGVSGRASLAALSAGQAEPGTMAELAEGRMRAKLPRLEQVLAGLRRAQQRRWLALQLAHSEVPDEQSDTPSGEVTCGRGEVEAEAPPPPDLAGPTGGAWDAPGPPMPLAQAVAVRDPMPGVGQRGAALLVAAWGPDRRRFGTARRLSAWTGVAPGNDARAGKQRSGKPRKGTRPRRTGLTHMAHAAARTKGT